MTPWLSVILPTIGRPGLERALRSVRHQQPDPKAVEIVVVEDTLDGVQPHIEALARQYSARYAGHAGTEHCWGHPQRNAGMELATGAWLAWMADDDVYIDGGLTEVYAGIIRHLHALPPLLFRVKMNQYGGRLIWRTRGLAPGNIDAECIAVPNDPGRLGRWTNRYEGDFDFIEDTVSRFGGARWIDAIIAIARPTAEEDWTCD